MLFVAAKLGQVEEAMHAGGESGDVVAVPPLPTSLEQFLAGIDARAPERTETRHPHAPSCHRDC